MIRIGIVAGEASGDFLGAGLINALKREGIEYQLEGIGGDRLQATGCHCLYPMEKLSVMGFSEVLGRSLELLGIRRSLARYFTTNPPDVFIGVDAPDFNFPLERVLRKKGVRVIHYVSPSVWAWREYRLKSIATAVDMMLTLFPFESPYYQKYGIPVAHVGHPLAGEIGLETDKQAARERLELPRGRILAVLPGSRRAELEKHTGPFLQAANWCQQQAGELKIISNLVNRSSRDLFRELARRSAPDIDVTMFSGRCHDVIAAADAVLLASGTVALEAMLIKRPMVVGYRVNWLTYQIAKRMIRTPYVSLPNLLAGRQLVPECLQNDCRPDRIGPALVKWLREQESVKQLNTEFTRLHRELMPISDAGLASIVMNVINAEN